MKQFEKQFENKYCPICDGHQIYNNYEGVCTGCNYIDDDYNEIHDYDGYDALDF